MLEANFDGLVGPTHNYAGLAHGNVASAANRLKPANPRQAALQGLDKMRRVASLGLPQAVLPPLERPDLDWLRRLGFTGKDAAVLDKASRQAPTLLAAAYSASSMWTANAATVSSSADSADGRVHLTPANLTSQIHRSLEPVQTAAILRRIFSGPAFVHHEPLPSGRLFADEGAANHTRLAPSHDAPGLQLFTYGFDPAGPSTGAAGSSGAAGIAGSRGPAAPSPRRFVPRQSRSASEAVARLHALHSDRTAFALQNPRAVDAGVFHNDVIAVGNGPVLFCHEAAFARRPAVLAEIRRKYAALGHGPLHLIEVKSREVSLAAAVSTYLFNSQILTLPSSNQGYGLKVQPPAIDTGAFGPGMLLLAAEECSRNPRTRKYLERLAASDPQIRAVEFADLRQSMRNGGGPACLRLRVPLKPGEWAQVQDGVKFDETLYARLRAWVMKHYRDRLLPKDLADPSLLRESRAALNELTRILNLGNLYPFQH